MARWTTAIIIVLIFDLFFALFGLTSSGNSPSSCLLNWALNITDLTGCGIYSAIFALVAVAGGLIIMGTFVSNSSDTILRTTGFIALFLPIIIDFGVAFTVMKSELANLIGTTPATFLSALIVSPVIVAMYLTLTDWIFGKD